MTGRRVPEQEQRHQAGSSAEGFEHLAVVPMAQQLPRLVAREPANLVDLAVRVKLAVEGLHRPVADGLRAALAVVVARRRELAAELAAEACLLFDLANRGLLVRLPGLELSLRKRPVVVSGPVDEQHLERSGVAAARDDSPGGLHDPVPRSAPGPLPAFLEPLPGLGEGRSRSSAPLALPLDDLPGREVGGCVFDSARAGRGCAPRRRRHPDARR